MKKPGFLTNVLTAGALCLAQVHPASAAVTGSLIKGASSTAVYYYAEDGKRHVFPTDKIYFSWYADFSGVTTLSDSDLARIMLGSNVTYHPGSRLVKIQTDPKVYAVGPGGALRGIATESVAKDLYGPDWNKQVDDIPDAFFVNYHEDTSIEDAEDFDLAGARSVGSINEDLSMRAPGGTPLNTPAPIPVPIPQPADDSVNLIANSSLEIPSSDSPSKPASWSSAVSEGSVADFAYPVTGYDGSAAAQVTISAYASGAGAQWYFDQTPVAPGEQYDYSEYYKSTTPSIVTMQFLLDDGTFFYLDLMNLAAAPDWTKASDKFMAPPHAVSVTALHLIQSVGTLTTDLFSLKQLPEGKFTAGMVSLNFDDGRISAYQNAIPILDASGIRTSQYIISKRFDKVGYVTVKQTTAMKASGHEIGAHTRTHPHLTQLSQADMAAEVAGSKSDLAALGMNTVTFAYPYGEFNNAVEQAVVDAGFRGARSTREGFNNRNTNPFELEDQHVESTTTFAQIKEWIDAARADKTWLILEMHDDDVEGGKYSITSDILKQVIAYLKTSGISVVTNSEGLKAMGH